MFSAMYACFFLQGFYFDLACNKCGSRTFDALWKYANLEQKCTIARELAKHESRLKGNRFGKFIYHKCSIGHLKQRPDNWKQNLENMEKAEKKHKLPGLFLLRDFDYLSHDTCHS